APNGRQRRPLLRGRHAFHSNFRRHCLTARILNVARPHCQRILPTPPCCVFLFAVGFFQPLKPAGYQPRELKRRLTKWTTISFRAEWPTCWRFCSRHGRIPTRWLALAEDSGDKSPHSPHAGAT